MQDFASKKNRESQKLRQETKNQGLVKVSVVLMALTVYSLLGRR